MKATSRTQKQWTAANFKKSKQDSTSSKLYIKAISHSQFKDSQEMKAIDSGEFQGKPAGLKSSKQYMNAINNRHFRAK